MCRKVGDPHPPPIIFCVTWLHITFEVWGNNRFPFLSMSKCLPSLSMIFLSYLSDHVMYKCMHICSQVQYFLWLLLSRVSAQYYQ